MSKKPLTTSERRTIKRSQIKLNPLNPKLHSEEAIKKQVRNFKKVGYLGGVVWNETSGNLIDGHRRVFAMDAYYGYADGNDYDIELDVCHLDNNVEKEQMTYMAIGNTKADFSLIAKYAEGLDLEGIGVSSRDIEAIETMMRTDMEAELETADDLFVEPEERLMPAPATRASNNATPIMTDIDIPSGQPQANGEAQGEATTETDADYEARRQHGLQVKKEQAFQSYDRGIESLSNVTIAFPNFESKGEFLEFLGFDARATIVAGDDFLNAIRELSE